MVMISPKIYVVFHSVFYSKQWCLQNPCIFAEWQPERPQIQLLNAQRQTTSPARTDISSRLISALLLCVFFLLPSLFVVGAAGLVLVQHNKVSVQLLQEEEEVGGGENGCFPWEPASALATVVSSGEIHPMDRSQTAMNERHIFDCKCNIFSVFVESALATLSYSNFCQVL